ncbi:MAG TPA: S8 family peptidase [Bryobacteraceae bacterium]|nr:S8 family peptidase [Bryobacteraceae bacterium]
MSQQHHPQLKSFLVSPPVRKEMDAQDPAHPTPIAVIITLRQSKTDPSRGVSASKQRVREFLEQRHYTVQESDFYVFASLLPADIDALAEKKEWVHQIWKDEKCYAHLLSSVDTVKASACWRTFEARGKGIVWAVLDTGVKADHPHFDNTVDLALSKNVSNSPTLDDHNGHGTHVAGIIAGCGRPKPDQQPYKAAVLVEEEDDPQVADLPGCPSGIAPLARIINVKVLDDDGTGSASAAIMGLEYVRKLNQNSRHIMVDGVNMSLGYPFDPKWYGCGHSPLCEEVTRAVRSGLIVVISCGNSGYGVTKLDTGQEVPTWVDLSITDPANTEEAIAVGSVHKIAPHTYGVSYFSSKGPTGDGRTKPDLVAPGEKIISCSIHLDKGYEYEEKSGTSMAAPHVSGAAAAFLSAHPEFRGSPREVKDIFMKTATDLNRARNFQGAGLIDIMRAISGV